MENTRYIYNSRGLIRPLPRSCADKSLAGHEVTPIVAKENVTNYSVVTTVFAPTMPIPFQATNPYKKPITISKPQLRNLDKTLALTTNKAMLLSRAIEAGNYQHQSQRWFDNLMVRRLALGTFLVLLLGSTGYVSINTWQTNTQARQVLAKIDGSTNSGIEISVDNQSQLPPGIDTAKPSADNLANYKVAADLPRAIYIDKINVSARILPMGVNDDNSVQAPQNAYDAGWYNASTKPGQDGAMLIDGHSSETGTNVGLFGNLTTIVVGDQIIVERGDGVRFAYNVVNTTIEPVGGLDMSKMLIPYGGAKQGLNIISCTGKWNSDKSSLDQRLLVFAVLQG